ncbi:MAG: 4,5-DOPA dioxygenase extradiol [Candidatus Binatia bacterium]
MSDTARMPAIFFGHGNPMNAIQHNDWTREWSNVGKTMPRPRAIVSISAHWYVPGIAVTAVDQPRTIYDFGGFPNSLYRATYPAPGERALAARVQALLSPAEVAADHRWGLDHGTWSVLRHVFPDADIPVVQLSLDATRPAGFHYALAARLVPLRAEGVLIMGTGNLVHNLHTYSWGVQLSGPFPWAAKFEREARQLIEAKDNLALVHYDDALGEEARLAVPTPDHFLPLLYVLAQRQEDEPVTFPVEGMDGGSVSMLAVCVG